jgi:hypothetical protein
MQSSALVQANAIRLRTTSVMFRVPGQMRLRAVDDNFAGARASL